MQVVADLQIHSRFARAVSSQMRLPVIYDWARKKGIGLVATGDWTHPVWYRELRSGLVEAGEGLYKLNLKFQKQTSKLNGPEPLFLLSTEISSVYSQGGKGRKIHILIFAPDFGAVEKINKELVSRGANLLSDGRPIVLLSAKEVAEVALTVDERCLVVPAHVWTPWFSLYGSVSGFDSIEECFGSLADEIFAVETGLSSDPAMNWGIKELENRAIVSFSDAHSPQKLGREATTFQIKKSKLKNRNYNSEFKITYKDVYDAIKGDPEADWEIGYTIEFYPEEGKYYYSGHRNCKVRYSPKQVREKGIICPVCGRSLTVGVASRVESLSSQAVEIKTEEDEFGARWIKDAKGKRPPYIMLVPLLEILSEALSSGVGTKTVMFAYDQLINLFGGEFSVLLKAPIEEIEKAAGKKVAEAIKKVRVGDIIIEPGYDGVFGRVSIWKEKEAPRLAVQSGQTTLF